MLPLTLTDEQWQKMLPILRSHPNAYVGQKSRNADAFSLPFCG
jgi:uncharacterized membrane protein YcgQ (UPF0703/DUF1980 family)